MSTLTIAANLSAIRQFCAAAGAFGGLAPRFLGQSVYDSEITPERLQHLDSEITPERLQHLVRDANDTAAHVCRVRVDEFAPAEIEAEVVVSGLRSTALVLTYGSGRTFARLEYAIGSGAEGGDIATFSIGVYQCDDVLKAGVDFASVLTSIEVRRVAAEDFAMAGIPDGQGGAWVGPDAFRRVVVG